jgi:nucleoid DNA-binding protein/nucleoid-associated protein YgaU
MAENKLSWTELRRALAARAGVSEKEATAFLNAFQTQLIEALKTDKQVKVNGLGTFKLQAVAPRKSVNVKTGEEITIEGYNKIAFVPEAGVKELVESVQPSAVAPSEIDPLQKLGAQANEIVDILGELGQPVKETEEVKEPEPVKEEPVVVPEPVKEPEPVIVPPIPPIPSVTPKPEPEPEPEPEKPKKKFHFLRDVLICVVILLFLLLGGFFFLRHKLSSWMDGLINGSPEQTEVVAEIQQEEAEAVEVFTDEVEATKEDNIDNDQLSNIDTGSLTDKSQSAESIYNDCMEWLEDQFYAVGEWCENLYRKVKRWIMGYFEPAEITTEEIIELDEEEFISEIEEPAEEVAIEVVEEVAVEPVVEPTETMYTPGQYNNWITTEYITEGSRLAWIAKKYYGNKVYWPYLYDANRDHITNPSNIVIDTPIRVPKLTAAQRDTTSAQFIQLREEAYGKVRGER